MEVERERALQRMLRKPFGETANNFGVELVPYQNGQARACGAGTLTVDKQQSVPIAPARVWGLLKVELVPPLGDTGKARDAVGAQLGVSGGTGSG